MTKGIEITQKGSDVRSAADYQKILDSRWEFLEIAVEQVVTTINDSNKAIKILDHNLGYLPAFYYEGVLEGEVFADTKSIWFFSGFSTGHQFTSFFRVYSCDITSEYLAPSSTTIQDGSGADTKVGLKILANRSDDIESTDMEKFTLNTNAKALSIQMHGRRTADPDTSVLLVQHNVGYPPTFFLASLTDLTGISFGPGVTGDTVIGPLGDTPVYTTADGFQINFSGVQAGLFGDYAVMILKDPVEVAS